MPEAQEMAYLVQFQSEVKEATSQVPFMSEAQEMAYPVQLQSQSKVNKATSLVLSLPVAGTISGVFIMFVNLTCILNRPVSCLCAFLCS